MAWPQTEERKSVFEAASIKPSSTTDNSSRYNFDAGRMTGENWTLASYVRFAYGVKPYQLAGVTGWMDADRYDIVATLDNPDLAALPGGDRPRLRHEAEGVRMREALQALLAERFRLKIHRERKMLMGFALTVAKGGFKLEPVTSNELPNMHSTGRRLTAERWSMERMADFLASQLNQPVADETKVEGIFNLTLEWAPDDLRARSSDPSQAPSIFTAIQEQLGLRLEPRRVPVEMIVVDSVERPTEN
jgi:uncharacterized protein (TIGR03435 family)